MGEIAASYLADHLGWVARQQRWLPGCDAGPAGVSLTFSCGVAEPEAGASQPGEKLTNPTPPPQKTTTTKLKKKILSHFYYPVICWFKVAVLSFTTKGTTAAASRFELGTSQLRVHGLIH